MKQKYFLLFMSLVGLSCNGMEQAKGLKYTSWDEYTPIEEDHDVELNISRRKCNPGVVPAATYDLEEEFNASRGKQENKQDFLRRMEWYFQCAQYYLTCGFLKQEKPVFNMASMLGKVKEIELIGEDEDCVVYLVKSEPEHSIGDFFPLLKKKE